MNEEWLARAEERLFSAGIGDLGDQLCRANMTFGLAKIHFVQERLGLDPSAIFIGAPDATVTRNTYRWRQGFGYGGVVDWGEELAILDAKPNGCGMLVGALERPPDEEAVRRAAASAREDPGELEGVDLRYDLHESNHFVDACRLEETLPAGGSVDLPQHIFVIHSSGHEHRASSTLGPGLYIDESEELRRAASVEQTPWGDLSLLRGEDADAYFRFCRQVQRFNERRRALFGRRLFGDFQAVCNVTHQGFRSAGVFHLGSYWFDDDSSLFPFTLGPDQPVYLVRPRASFSPEAIAALGWEERARALGLLERVAAVNVLPHGGGYGFQRGARLVEARNDGTSGRFVVADPDGTRRPVERIRELPFRYRGSAVLDRLLELGMAEPVARYRILFVVKE